jgi:hypothetical protein
MEITSNQQPPHMRGVEVHVRLLSYRPTDSELLLRFSSQTIRGHRGSPRL